MSKQPYNVQMEENSFAVTQGFQSYVSKPEITALSPNYLVKGSRNVLIDYAARVISRNGYKLYNQANSGAGAIKGSYDWNTSTGKFFNLRSYDKNLEFDWNGTYNSLVSNLTNPYLEFCQVNDFTEQTDVLLFVQGDKNYYRWSGGVSKVWKSTSTTLTKQGVLTAATTIAFVAGTPGTVAPTITDSANNFLNAGFAAGDTLYITGSPANSNTFTIGSVVAGTITLIMTNSVTAEGAGAAITVHNGEATWKQSRFFAAGYTLGVATMTIASPGVVSFTGHGLVLNDTVRFTTTGALPTRLVANTDYYVIAGGLTANAFELALTQGGTAL